MQRFLYSYKLSYIVALIFAALVLSSCKFNYTTRPEAESVAADYSAYPAYMMDIATLEFSNEYRPKVDSKNNEGLKPSTSEAVKSWAQVRFKPKGASKTMRVVVNKAETSDHELIKDKGITAWFKKEPVAKVEGKLDVTFKIFNEKEILPEAEMHIAVTAHKNVMDESDKQTVLDDLNALLLNELNQETDKQIKNYLGKYLIY